MLILKKNKTIIKQTTNLKKIATGIFNNNDTNNKI